MGELQTEPFQFTFNGFLKVAFQGSRVTSDAGLILVRELDERLGLERIMPVSHEATSRSAQPADEGDRRLMLTRRSGGLELHSHSNAIKRNYLVCHA